jgi:uncharacterized protein
MAAYPTPHPTPAAPATGLVSAVRRHPLVAYFSLAFLWTWALLVPFALDSNPAGLRLFAAVLPDMAFFVAFVLATFGPLAAGLIVTGALEGKAGIRRFLGRFVQWRVGLRWYAAALFGFGFVFLAAYSLVYRGAPALGLAQQWPVLFTAFLPGVLAQMLIPALGEEPGWRGFALPRLQAQYGPVAGSLVLGALHGLWHMPVMFTLLLGPFSLSGLGAFVVTAMGGTLIYTWIYNHTRGSILIAMLTHAASNASSSLLTEFIPTDVVEPALLQAIGEGWLNALAFGVAAAVLLIATRGRLGYRNTEEGTTIR